MNQMFGFFDDVIGAAARGFGGGGQNHHAAHHPPPAPSSGASPPASAAAIASLPNVKVTADDLLEETNKECVICLVDQDLGSTACKLPCGHLFHKQCVTEWLQKKCMCPVCRYELETADPSFEAERKARMKTRKLRMRLDEIQAKSISQLRAICTQFSINTSRCIDKQEIVQAIVASGCVDVTERLPPVELTEEEFSTKSVGQLKQLMLSFGLDAEGALEKTEIRNIILASGRIVLVKEAASAPAESTKEPLPMPTSPIREATSPVSLKSPLPPYPSGSGKVAMSRSDLKAMSLGNLRLLCSGLGVSLAGCLYKDDIVDRVALCSKFELLDG